MRDNLVFRKGVDNQETEEPDGVRGFMFVL